MFGESELEMMDSEWGPGLKHYCWHICAQSSAESDTKGRQSVSRRNDYSAWKLEGSYEVPAHFP